MDAFCGSKFWDLNVTWYTESPDFTICFQETALTWIPCLTLWLLSPYDIYSIIKSNKPPVPISFLNIFRIILSSTLVILSLTEQIDSLLTTTVYDDSSSSSSFVFHSYPVSYYTPLIKLISFIFATTLIYYERLKGIHTSPVLTLFWFLLSITSVINYRSLLTAAYTDTPSDYDGIGDVLYSSRMASNPIVVLLFIVSCFADTMPQYCNKTADDSKEVWPSEYASALSLLTFWWVNPLMKLGYSRPLTMRDMWIPLEGITTPYNIRKFAKYYNFGDTAGANASNNSESFGGEDRKLIQHSGQRPKSRGILLPLLKTYWAFTIILFSFKVVNSLVLFVNPIVLNWFISFVSDQSEPAWRGVLFSLLFFFSSMFMSFSQSLSQYYNQYIRMKMRACMVNAIYRKSLMLSNDGRKNFTIGELVNLMTMDTHRIVEFVPMVNQLWAAPVQIAIALYLLWAQLGVATLAGVAVMIVLLPLNAFFGARLRLLQIALMKLKDRRIKLMNEILSGIRVWKMYAWEKSFNEKVMQLRNSEIGKLVTRAFYNGFIIFSFHSAQVLVSVISFTVFVLIDSNNVLDANVAFVSLTLFGILGGPLTSLPGLITSFIMFSVSLRRVNKYLNSDEIDGKAIEHNPSADPIVMENASFCWSKHDMKCTLKNISLAMKKNKLVAVVGQVGCGKSSLLSAILGDMYKMEGKVNVIGSIAYVPQQPWILNTTLRNNVLLLKEISQSKFDQVINCCAMTPDLEILPGGDLTEIGEKGINLSGGQKQRVSMARACYMDCDTYLLDDPISALDANVGKHVFDKVIGPNGILRNKTRILVTHRISFLPQVDEVIVIKDGMISEYGTYRELLNKKGDFAEFLIQYLEQSSDDALNDEDLEIMEEIVSIEPALMRRFSRTSRSLKSVNSSEDGVRLRRSTSALSKAELGEQERGDEQKARKRQRDAKKSRTGKLIEEETAETGAVKWSVYADYLKKIGYFSLFGVFMSDVFLSAMNFGSSLWLQAWSDDSLDPQNANNTGLRDLRLAVYGAFGGGQTVFTLVSTISITLACLRGAKILHNEMLEHMMRAPMYHFDTTPMGRILNRFSKDIDTADTVLGMSIRMVMMRLFSTIVSFSILGYETPYVLVAVVPLGVLYYFIQRYYIATSRQLRRIQSNARSPVIGHFSETLSGVSSIRAYALTDQFTTESNTRVDTHHNSLYESASANRWLATRLEFLGYSIVLLDSLFIVFSRKTITPGMAGLTLTYATKITGTLNSLVTATTTLETDIVSVERCVEYTQTPTEAEWFIERTKPSPLWPQSGAIKFDNYSTRYREGLDLVLKQIDLKVECGQRIGVVGRTGAGKSSLTLALFRLLEPCEGTILIDDVDISRIGLYDLRSKLTIIPQDPVLFTGNLRINLDPFDAHTDHDIWSALELAHLKTFVSGLSAGLNHSISEGGMNLSVGQKQLVCLARAVLRRSRVLILDEATAAIDVETDELIQQTIRLQFRDCTIITIAHRLNTIIDYDRILVMSEGRVAEFDSPQALLNNHESQFYSMAKDANII